MRQLALAVVTVLALAGCTTIDTLEKRAEPLRSSTPSAVGGHGKRTAPDSWRTEVWHDVQLRVPRSWTVGYAPMSERGGALLCGTGPLESRPAGPYVGRPGYGSDLCEHQDLSHLRLDGEGVWFGSPVPVGEVIVGKRVVQSTVPVAGTRVTVASEDEPTLRRILGSIAQVAADANGCPARPRVERHYPVEGYGEVQSLSVCLFERGRMWSTRLPADAAARFLAAVERAEPAGCTPEEHPREQRFGQVLIVRVHADDPFGKSPLPRDYVLHGGECPALEVAAAPPGPRYLELTRGLVRPWAGQGTRTYAVDDGFGRGLSRYFRPVWG